MSVPFAVLRHAPTVWNGEGRLQGTTDIPLSADGEAAAKTWHLPAPADRWKRVCSPLIRARRTAELVQPAAPVTVDSRLREMSFGVWEGKSVAQLRAEGGETFAAAERLGLDFHPPGGESPRMTMERLSAWAREIAAGEPVVARDAQGRDPRPAGAGDRLGHDGPPAAQARLALPAFLLGQAPTARSRSIGPTCRCA